MSETREEQAKRLDAYAELCYGDSPVVQANRDAFRAGAEALRGRGWQDISTADITELLHRADSYLSLLWHRHVTLDARRDVDLIVNVERTIGDLRRLAKSGVMK